MSNELVKLVRRVRSGIDTWDVPGTKRTAAERDLLRLLETGIESERLGELKESVYGLKGVLADLGRIITTGYQLPKAIYATSHKGWTKAKVRETFGPVLRAVTEAEALADDLSVRLGSFVPAEELPSWAVDLHDEQETIRVIIDQRALADLVLPAIEAFQVPRTKTVRYSEVGGLCFGHVRRAEVRDHGRGDAAETSIFVSWCVPQLRARMHEDSVTLSADSQDVLLASAAELMPHVEYLGGFHSHPYKRVAYSRKSGLAEMRDVDGWSLSDGDRESLRAEAAELRKIGRRSLVEIVVAIGDMDRRGGRAHDAEGAHTFQFIAQNLTIVMGAYVIRMDGEARPADSLTCWWRDETTRS